MYVECQALTITNIYKYFYLELVQDKNKATLDAEVPHCVTASNALLLAGVFQSIFLYLYYLSIQRGNQWARRETTLNLKIDYYT